MRKKLIDDATDLSNFTTFFSAHFSQQAASLKIHPLTTAQNLDTT